MAAQIQTLYPQRPLQLQPLAGEAMGAPASVTHPLQAQLRERMVQAGEDVVRAFVDEMDAAVQALLAESRNASETRAVLDLGHSLSMNRPAFVRGFVAALKARFDPLKRSSRTGVFDLERLCLLPTEEMEENIVLSHLAQQAEEKAGEDGRQLLSRLQWAARDLGLPALSSALNASTLPDCFAQALRAAGLAMSERVLAYRLVESHALNAWPLLVQTALAILDQLGLQRARPLSDRLHNAVAQDVAPMISAATLQALRALHTSPVADTDATLAQALLRAIEPPFGGSDAGFITALAGSWMDSLIAEPELPPAFAPELESLRLAIIKAALCDPTFFTQAVHPVRKAVDELLLQAAFIGLQGYSLAPLRLELKHIAARISIHGQFAMDALSMLLPLDGDLAYQFRQQMSREQDARRESLLHRIRALATREIDARTLDLSLPTAARGALTRGFLPLLCTLMLRHGAASPQTRQARQLLERFVDSFALCIGHEERQAVLRALHTIFLDVGLPDLHIADVCAELEKAYAELEEEAQRAKPSKALPEAGNAPVGTGVAMVSAPSPGRPSTPTSMSHMPDVYSLTPIIASNEMRTGVPEADPLVALLKTGQWFRVRDYKRGDDRWLSLVGVHLEQDRVNFSGFDGVIVLAMRASQFVEDLTSGLAEPLNPEPLVQQALQTLRARAASTAERLRSFG
ncbi:MAG: DUF1631 family protein [Stagnimonas sp.]|nr:DUF1631 family protein [Stagnimonas sp.]